MRFLPAACLPAALALALLAGCGTPAAPRHHSLLPPPASAPPPAAAALAWRLGPVGVPAGLDRPQWVVRAADDSLAVLEQERWIAPLADELAGALDAGLMRRLGPAALAGAPAWTVHVDVQRLEAAPARSARLEAVWWLLPPAAGAPGTAPCPLVIERAVGAGYPALAAGQREAVAALAQRLSDALQAAAAGRPVACASPA
jgi:hypothetical protein